VLGDDQTDATMTPTTVTEGDTSTTTTVTTTTTTPATASTVTSTVTTGVITTTRNVTTVADHSITVAFSVLGAIYGVAALSALFFIVIPRVLASNAAAVVAAGRPTAGLSGVTRAARSVGTRWTPRYGADMARYRHGGYLPRSDIEMQPVNRVSAIPNRQFPPYKQV